MGTVLEIPQIAHSKYEEHGLSRENLVSMLRKIIEIRRFEEKIEELYVQKGLLIGPAHLYLGQEAVAVGVTAALRDEDYIISRYRGHGHAIAREIPLRNLMAEIFGKSTGTCKGLGGSMHVAIYPKRNCLYASAIVGSTVPIATGVGLGLKYRGTDLTVVTYIGDGDINTGGFHEGLNLAAIWKLPVILVCENNMYAVSMRADKATASKSIAERALAYDAEGISVYGNDPVATYLSTKRAVQRARSGLGPTLIECRTYRTKGHGVYDKAEYRPKEEVDEWLKRDPLANFEKSLLDARIVSSSDVQAIEDDVRAQLEDATNFAIQSPVMNFAELQNYLYRSTEPIIEQPPAESTRTITYADAVREAMREEMSRDETIVIFGEDVGVYGGAFKVTRGLFEEFGPERVRDTPISETAVAGAAVGAALAGLKPVAEIMYMDFLALCLDQIVTQAAKMHFMSGGEISVPMVIRTQYSLGRTYGSQHCQFLASWFLQVPGVKVVLPSTPYDAKGLLKASIHDGNPVLFVECGELYRARGTVPETDYRISLGKADVKKQGNSVTVVAISRMVLEALAAATTLEKKGISVEVIDPRTIQPLDMETILNSVKKTGRLVIAEDAPLTGGIGATISSAVTVEAFDYLDGPILRVAAPDLPVPFSPSLEKEYMPNREKIAATVARLFPQN